MTPEQRATIEQIIDRVPAGDESIDDVLVEAVCATIRFVRALAMTVDRDARCPFCRLFGGSEDVPITTHVGPAIPACDRHAAMARE
jgi:hypothetical protein